MAITARSWHANYQDGLHPIKEVSIYTRRKKAAPSIIELFRLIGTHTAHKQGNDDVNWLNCKHKAAEVCTANTAPFGIVDWMTWPTSLATPPAPSKHTIHISFKIFLANFRLPATTCHIQHPQPNWITSMEAIELNNCCICWRQGFSELFIKRLGKPIRVPKTQTRCLYFH